MYSEPAFVFRQFSTNYRILQDFALAFKNLKRHWSFCAGYLIPHYVQKKN